MRVVWRGGGVLLTVALLFSGVTGAVGQIAHEEESLVWTYEASDVARVEVDSSAGNVTVVGGATNEVRVDARVSHGLQETAHTEELDGDVLRLSSSCPFPMFSNFCDVTYTIEMPAAMPLTMRVHGHAQLSNLRGPVDVVSGDNLVATDLGGDEVRLRSRWEGVQASGLTADRVIARAGDNVQLSFSEAPTTVEAESSWEGVDVALPDDGEPYALTARSRWEREEVHNIRQDPDSERTIDVAGGDTVTVRYRG